MMSDKCLFGKRLFGRRVECVEGLGNEGFGEFVAAKFAHINLKSFLAKDFSFFQWPPENLNAPIGQALGVFLGECGGPSDSQALRHRVHRDPAAHDPAA